LLFLFSRSTRVTTHAAFGKTDGHSAKGLFVVSTIDLPFSYRRVTTSKRRSAWRASYER
jgi:hypothetical protein